MTQRERERMQEGPRELQASAVGQSQRAGSAVSRVAGDGKRQRGEMRADLVGAAGLRKRGDERGARQPAHTADESPRRDAAGIGLYLARTGGYGPEHGIVSEI